MAGNVGGDSNQVEVNLMPLLDLVLQLIMFFMITVNFVRTDQFDDDIKLPVAQHALALDASAEDFIFLNLDKDGKLAGTRRGLDLDSPERLKAHLILEKSDRERLARIQGKSGEVKVVIVLRAHMDCRYREIWQVIDSCQRAGFRRWQLRVMTKPGAA